jgi:predicted NAD/FAD-dependent oxidoreductase
VVFCGYTKVFEQNNHTMMLERLIVIGSGAHASVYVRELHSRFCITVIDKAKRLGGRLLFRSVNGSYGAIEYPFGAPLVQLQNETVTLTAAQALRQWATVICSTRVTEIASSAEGVVVTTQDGQLYADRVVVTAPIPQTIIFAKAAIAEDTLALLREVRYAAQYVVMCVTKCPANENHVLLPQNDVFDRIVCKHIDQRWFAVTAFATYEWSGAHLNVPRNTAEQALVKSLSFVIGATTDQLHEPLIHLWRYALPVNPMPSPRFSNSFRNVVIGGDGMGNNPMDGVFLL